jgi:uncharacterized protein (TIGR03437 family)
MSKALIVFSCDVLCFIVQVAAANSTNAPGILYATTVIDSETTYSPPQVSAMAVDTAGNNYVAGSIQSSGLQTTPGVVQPRYAGGSCQVTPITSLPCEDAFIAKFNAQGQLVFLTYLGGTGADVPISIAVDSAGNIYVGGATTSKDFPLAGSAWRPVLQSGPTSFVAKLATDGSTLIYSTVVNGSLTSMAAVPEGTVYFITQTYASQAVATLTQLAPGGSLVSSFNQPSGTQAVAVGQDGSVFIGGSTDGTDISTTIGAWQSAFGGGVTDGFVAKLGPDLAHFAWVTFLGGTDVDSVSAIEADPSGAIWVAGSTASANFPVLAGAWQAHAPPTISPLSSIGFLVRLAGDGSKALASTFVPGAPQSLSVDAAADVVISAANTTTFEATPGAQWPCIQPFRDQFGQLSISANSQFLAKLDAVGEHLLWGTWVGSSIPAGPAGLDRSGNAVAAGNIPGERNITLAAMTTQTALNRLVASCVNEAGHPYLPGAIAPGEILSIYGAGFGPRQGVSAQVIQNRIGTQLAGVQVLVEGVPAPLLYVSAAQINLVAPYSIGNLAEAHMWIVSSRASSNEVILQVAPAAPEIFESQPGLAAILNQDGTINGPEHPAHPGDVVALFGSGAGEMMPAAVDGEIPKTPVRKPVLPVRLHLSSGLTDLDANIQYAGEAPMLVSGVLQVNFRVPVINAFGPPPYYVYLALYIGNFGANTSRVLVVSE